MSALIVYTCTKGPDILSKKPFVKLAVSCFFVSITIVIVFVFIVIIVVFIKIIIIVIELDNLCIDL